MNEFREIICHHGDEKLYGYLKSKDSKNNLMLIPGSYTSCFVWRSVIEDTDIDANILLAELPGFGKSRPKYPNGSIEQFADSLLALTETAGFRRFYVGGHSIGGMIAISMLEIAESRIDGIISCEGWSASEVEQEAFGSRKNETLSQEQLNRRQQFGAMAKRHWNSDELASYCCIWRNWKKGYGLLEACTCPVLELWGDRDMPVLPERKLLQIPQKSNIQLVWLEHCGHSMLVQQPHTVGRLIREFIGGAENEKNDFLLQRD